MDALVGYGSDESELPAVRPDSAPSVDTCGFALLSAGLVVPLGATKALHDPARHVVYHNPRVSDLHAPVAGPAHPYRAQGMAAGERNHPTGHVEDAHVGTWTFEEQFNTFQAYGYSMEPGGEGFVGDTATLASRNGARGKQEHSRAHA